MGVKQESSPTTVGFEGDFTGVSRGNKFTDYATCKTRCPLRSRLFNSDGTWKNTYAGFSQIEKIIIENCSAKSGTVFIDRTGYESGTCTH